MDKQSFTLYSAQQGHQLFSEAWKHVKAELMAGRRVVVKIEPETRSLEQNKKLHASLSDISEQVEWSGKKFSVDIWKRLCVAAWLREKQESPMLIPALDGNGFDVIYEKTAKMNLTQCSELIEWVLHFGVEHGCIFRDMEDSK